MGSRDDVPGGEPGQDQFVIALIVEDRVLPVSLVVQVGIRTLIAIQDIISFSAHQHIIPLIAEEGVGAVSAIDDIPVFLPGLPGQSADLSRTRTEDQMPAAVKDLLPRDPVEGCNCLQDVSPQAVVHPHFQDGGLPEGRDLIADKELIAHRIIVQQRRGLMVSQHAQQSVASIVEARAQGVVSDVFIDPAHGAFLIQILCIGPFVHAPEGSAHLFPHAVVSGCQDRRAVKCG